MNDDFAQCCNCGKQNKRQPCGYYMCDCKRTEGNSVLWYLPIEIYNWRRGIWGNKDKLFSNNKEKMNGN